jgi:hypothetical protein
MRINAANDRYMSGKPPECYGCDPRARGIRLEISAHHSLILPYEHLVYTELKAGEVEDCMTLMFVTHEVTLCGRRLKGLENPIQERELAWVCVRAESQWELGKIKISISKMTVKNLDDENALAVKH